MIKKYNTAVIIFLICLMSNVAAYAESFRTIKNVSYSSRYSDEAQKLDIHIPENIKRNSKIPVHIYVHGGAWTKGDKSLKHTEIKSYTDRNIILVSINYRLGPEHKYPDNVRDVIRASKWVRNNISKYGGDPNNLVLSGHSAGGHLVALLGVGTPDAKNIPSSLLFKAIFPIDTATYNLTEPSQGKLSRLVDKQKLAAFGDDKAILRRASPLHQINKNIQYAPFHLYVTSARLDAVQGTKEFKTALKSSNHKAYMRILEDSLSHSDMRDEIFDSSSPIFNSILNVLNDVLEKS